MTIHLAICPHFHQPYFQIEHSREGAYQLSYLPWGEVFSHFSHEDGFFLNCHFSGPWILWMQQWHPGYLEGLKKHVRNGAIGIIGGFLDETFAQLSSRPDDIHYQLAGYNRLIENVFGVTADEWQAVHIVEREYGERLISGLANSCRRLGAPPLFYLDAETAFCRHFARAGSHLDYYQHYFGASDPCSVTTASHLPHEQMTGIYRDEIDGNEMYVIPLHSIFRYYFLKRERLDGRDRPVSPEEFIFIIKDFASRSRAGDPLILVFEDAEKLGMWSGCPEQDQEWFCNFIRLVLADRDIVLTGPRFYFQEKGYGDTYPVRSSHGYPEFENWTAKRGIRGLVWGDPKLRRTISCLRRLERELDGFERSVLKDAGAMLDTTVFTNDWIAGLIMDSSRRQEAVAGILDKTGRIEIRGIYDQVQRMRHMAYQEDPKWISRHPSFGPCSYFETAGLGYLDIAGRLLKRVSPHKSTGKVIVTEEDWDFDGNTEIVVETPFQFLVFSPVGGRLIYHQVSRVDCLDTDGLKKIVDGLIEGATAGQDVFRYSLPLLFTEADSDLKTEYYPEGGREECARDAFRLQLYWVGQDHQAVPLGSGLDRAKYRITITREHEDRVAITMGAEASVTTPYGEVPVAVRKTFTIHSLKEALDYSISLSSTPEALQDIKGRLVFSAQLVTSVAPSDEKELAGKCRLVMSDCREKPVPLTITTGEHDENGSLDLSVNLPGHIDYQCDYRHGRGEYGSGVGFTISPTTAGQAIGLRIKPAVASFYKGYLLPGRSDLRVATAGICLEVLSVVRATGSVQEGSVTWRLDTPVTPCPQSSHDSRVIELTPELVVR